MKDVTLLEQTKKNQLATKLFLAIHMAEAADDPSEIQALLEEFKVGKEDLLLVVRDGRVQKIECHLLKRSDRVTILDEEGVQTQICLSTARRYPEYVPYPEYDPGFIQG